MRRRTLIQNNRWGYHLNKISRVPSIDRCERCFSPRAPRRDDGGARRRRRATTNNHSNRQKRLSFEHFSNIVDGSMRAMRFLELHEAKMVELDGDDARRRTSFKSIAGAITRPRFSGYRQSIDESHAFPRAPRRSDGVARRRRCAKTNNPSKQ